LVSEFHLVEAAGLEVNRSGEIVMDDLAEIQGEVGNEMDAGNHLTHRQIGDGR
jgi:hypothetical protein